MGKQTDENVPSEHDGIQEPGDTETCIENGKCEFFLVLCTDVKEFYDDIPSY